MVVAVVSSVASARLWSGGCDDGTFWTSEARICVSMTIASLESVQSAGIVVSWVERKGFAPGET
jgi:hypothetical protein